MLNKNNLNVNYGSPEISPLLYILNNLNLDLIPKSETIFSKIIQHETFDPNLEMYVSAAAQRIEKAHDGYHYILNMLLKHEDLDINKQFGYQGLTNLAMLCSKRSTTIIGLQTLVQDSRCNINIETGEGTALYIAISCMDQVRKDHNNLVKHLIKSDNIDINAGKRTQSHLCCAVMLIQHNNDIFDEIACKILEHPNVNPNSECANIGRTSLIHLLESNLGQTETAQKIASHAHFDINAHINLSYELIPQHINLLEIIMSNERFNVNQRWSNKNNLVGGVERHKETLAIHCANDIQNLTDNYGEALKLLCNAGANLDICEHKESDSALLRFLKRSNMNRHFTASAEELDIVTFLLSKGANPNEPPHTLAFAIKSCPLEVCKLLLENKANPNSLFRTDDKMVANAEDLLSDSYKKLHIGSKETALHTAYRIASPRKIELLKSVDSSLETKWIGKTAEQLQDLYATEEYCSLLKINVKKTIWDEISSLETIRNCRQFFKATENNNIFENVEHTMTDMCRKVSTILEEDLKCELTGSCAENTKCYFPNEYDYTFTLLKTDLAYHKHFARRVYLALDSLIEMEELRTFDKRLGVEALLHENKIAKIRMMWKGEIFKNLVIFVDVAVCDEFEVAKYPRHAKSEINQSQESFHKQEQQMMRKLEDFQRIGYTLAKAVRISSISRPDDVIALGLEEEIYADNVITSFILKACLFDETGIKSDFNDCKSTFDVAVIMYEILLASLEQKLLESVYTGERSVYCRLCRVERGCCKKRLFMKAMVEKILTWLHTNETHLHDIDFA